MEHVTTNGIPQMVTVADVLAASRLPRTNVYRLLKDGRLQSVRVGKRILIPKAAVIELLTPTNQAMKK
jgi:excisionase family DNA binding protein